MNNLLITGHTGFVGQSLCNYLQNKGVSLIGIHRKESNGEGVQAISCNLASTDSFAFLDEHLMDGIIHLAANGNVNECEKNPAESRKINVQATERLARYAKKRNIPFVFASTDQVFDGEKGDYTINDIPKPLNEYGSQKLEAENAVLNVYPEAAVCRLPLMIGKHGGYMKAFMDNLKAGKEQMLFVDEIRSVLDVDEAVKKLYEALTWEGGIYHLPGPKKMNRFELGEQIVKDNNLDNSLLKKGLQSDVKMLAKRPKDVSMVK